MKKFINDIILKTLHKLPPELAHRLAINGLKMFPSWPKNLNDDRLKIKALGMQFSSPLGLAAGFDKSAEVPQELLNLGFSFVEVGTVTPNPQRGNPRPRLFRLSEDSAIINRMGFNNEGVNTVRLQLFLNKSPGIIGVSVGPNATTLDYLEDIKLCITELAAHVKYIAINISSPNTQGLRELQKSDVLSQLLFWAKNARDKVNKTCPILIKISPDISFSELDDIIDVALYREIDGIIIANTTITRPNTVGSPLAVELGGLSGPVLFDNTVKMLAYAHCRIKEKQGNLVLIGSGGITTAVDALTQIMAGAALVQIYTSFVYKGPNIIDIINEDLIDLVTKMGVTNISQLIGVNAKTLANQTSLDN